MLYSKSGSGLSMLYSKIGVWSYSMFQQEVKVIWDKKRLMGGIPRLGVTPGGRKLYHWIPGVGFPISVP